MKDRPSGQLIQKDRGLRSENSFPGNQAQFVSNVMTNRQPL